MPHFHTAKQRHKVGNYKDIDLKTIFATKSIVVTFVTIKMLYHKQPIQKMAHTDSCDMYRQCYVPMLKQFYTTN